MGTKMISWVFEHCNFKEKITWIKVGSQGPRVSYQNALTADEKGKAK